MFKVGDRVKLSEYALRPSRDYWLSCGREPQKSGAKAELDRLKALRGTVTEIKDTAYAKGVLTVVTDDGHRHGSLSYRWELCD